MAEKQLTFGFEDDLVKYPCADIQEWMIDVRREEEPAVTLKPLVVIPKNWDLRKEDLRHLNKDSLEDVFYGKWNLWVPTEMLDLENFAEIIASYLAAGVLKRYNSHRNNDKIPRGSFSELVKFMNSVAYSNPIFARASHKFKTRFSAKSREQEKRLENLSGDIKKQFCQSFWKEYRASKREEPENPEAFHDLNNRQEYIDQIYRYFTRRFEREHIRQ